MQYWGDSRCPDQLSQGEGVSVVIVVPLRLLRHSVVVVLCMVCAIGS